MKLIGERGWYEDLIETVRTMKNSEKEVLRVCADMFVEGKKYSFAQEVFTKVFRSSLSLRRAEHQSDVDFPNGSIS